MPHDSILTATATAAAIAIGAVSSTAHAADNGFYVGAGVTETDFGLDRPAAGGPFDDQDTGYSVVAGLRVHDHLGLEATYVDHGEATLPARIACIQIVGVDCPDTRRLSAESLSAFAVGFLPLPVVDLFAKAGVTSWSLDRHTPGFPQFRTNDDGTDFAWGAGVQAHLGSLGARLEYERFPATRDTDLGAVSLSFIYTFL